MPPQRSLLRTRDFGLIWSGQVVSQIGDGLNRVALLWFVYELTGSALKTATIGLLQTAPPLLLGPLIGVYLDRLPKKPVMIGVDLLRAALIVLIPALYALDALTLERLYLLVFLMAVVSTVFGPALAAAVPLLVRPARLTEANALIQSTANIGILLGPLVSGLGIAWIGVQHVLYVDAATFLISAFCLAPLHLREIPRSAPTGRASVARDLLAGFRFVFVQQPRVLLLMVTATFYSPATSAFVFLLPVVGKEILQLGPVTLGWLWSTLGVGMLLASLWLARRGRGQRENVEERLRMLARALVIGGMAVGALSAVERPLIAAGLVAVIGASTALFTPVAWAMVQEVTPAPLLGRVLTTFSTAAMASAMAGMAAFGWAAETFGPARTLGAVATVLLLAALVTAGFSRRVPWQPALA